MTMFLLGGAAGCALTMLAATAALTFREVRILAAREGRLRERARWHH